MKIIIAIIASIIFTTSALAGSCVNGANSWEEGRTAFEEKAKNVLVYVGAKEFPDKSIVVVYRDITKSDVFFAMVFDTNHCFVSSGALDAGDVATLGIASI
jgi:hypothetical protein